MFRNNGTLELVNSETKYHENNILFNWGNIHSSYLRAG
jgi:hypothetical protein